MTRTELIQQFNLGVWAAVHGFTRQPLSAEVAGLDAYEAGFIAGLTADREGMFGREPVRAPFCPCDECRTLPLTSPQVAEMASFRVPGGSWQTENEI